MTDFGTIDLTEHMPVVVSQKVLSEATATYLADNYKDQLTIDLAWRAGRDWQLTAAGWVGYIPLPDGNGISLQPKVPLANLFLMLEYAYSLTTIRILEGAFNAESLQEFYDRLARILTKRVLDRVRKGLHRAYCERYRNLTHLRGRLDVSKALRKPWDVRFPCHYREHTADIEDNQILMWTLWKLSRASVRRPETRLAVGRGYRTFQGYVELRPFKAKDCTKRRYNKLNSDYEVLHALCRFFLDHLGPSHEMGDRTMLPFLVKMSDLFELFAAQWLAAHLPPGWSVLAQEHIPVGYRTGLSFRIDLVLYDEASGGPACVLDTKYKNDPTPQEGDVHQVVAYAVSKGAKHAVLVYPTPLERPLQFRVGDVTVRTLGFPLGDDLEAAGHEFMGNVLRPLTVSEGPLSA